MIIKTVRKFINFSGFVLGNIECALLDGEKRSYLEVPMGNIAFFFKSQQSEHVIVVYGEKPYMRSYETIPRTILLKAFCCIM